MAKKEKFYVVWEGHRPGIYNSWEACKTQIIGYPGARYKKFSDMKEAKEAYQSSFSDHISTGYQKNNKSVIRLDHPDIIWQSISVDAACSGNPGIMEYRGVETKTGKEIFKQGPFQQGTNNIGEFLAIVHALAMLKRKGKHHYPVYSDSRTAILWVKKKNANTKLIFNQNNVKLRDLITRAEKWLESNTYQNPIHKWETKSWGEIPADFGRK
jgi:ribonuclease HI